MPVGSRVIHRWLFESAFLLACIVATGLVALSGGQDTNWDLQNYHFYNAWAARTGRGLAFDVAPAQLQTFHNPLADFPLVWMVLTDWNPRLITFALAIPAGVGVYFYAKALSLFFLSASRTAALALRTAAFAIGVTSVMAVAMMGTTMNEWPVAAPLLVGLWLLLRANAHSPAAPLPWPTLVLAGVLCGLASGVKLTGATFAVAILGALLTRRWTRAGTNRFSSACGSVWRCWQHWHSRRDGGGRICGRTFGTRSSLTSTRSSSPTGTASR